MTPVEINLATVTEVVDGRPSSGDLSRAVTSVAIDSRQAAPGSLFVAFRGEKTDGHRYLAQCRKQGAVAALVEQAVDPPPGLVTIRVKNTMRALQQLAAYRRLQLPALTVIGVTGSTGKTTTKELIAAVLANYPVYKSAGNQNNEIGLPLAMFDISPEQCYAVLEMAMSAPGELRDLCRVSRPGFGIITNVGVSHLEKMGSREAILAAKFELAEDLQSPGIMIVKGDDPAIRQRADETSGPNKYIFFGLEPFNDFWADEIAGDHRSSSFDICWQGNRQRIELPLPGRHNILNALAAFALGLELAISPRKIAGGLRDFPGVAGRLQQREIAGMTILDDTYNASPDSSRAALDVLKSTPAAGRRIAFFGDMLELGPIAADEHFALGQLAAEMQIDILVAVGMFSANVKRGALAGGMVEENIYQFSTSMEAVSALDTLRPGDVVLFKGSRGAAMEILIDFLTDGG